MSSTRENADIELLRKVGSPLRIGRTLAPRLWGERVTFRADPFLKMAEVKVMDAIEDVGQRFVKMNAPPQVSKSTFVELLTPLWALYNWPDSRIINIGYSDDLAIRSGSLCRDVIAQWGPELFGMDIDPKYDSKQEWRLHGHLGGMLSVGIGSRITGMPGDLIIIGDVIKNLEEAASQRTKDTHWNEFNGSILSRLQPHTTVILAATRFAEDDISGRIDDAMRHPDYDGDEWESLVFKSIAEPDFDEDVENLDEWRDILGRRIGEPLQTRFSARGESKDQAKWHDSHFYRRKRALHANGQAFAHSCIYQQTPTSPTGGMFPPEKWAWYDPAERPRMVAKRRAWDLAASEGGGDWTVGGLVGKDDDDNVFILDITRFQKGPDAVLDEVKATAAADGVATPILVEGSRNGDGKTVVAFYAKALRNYSVDQADADGSKETRARPYSVMQQKGRVFLPRYHDGTKPDWVAEFIEEHRKMMGDGRKGRHDDQIDVCAHAINAMLDSEMVEMLVPNVAMSDAASGFIVIDQDDDEEIDPMTGRRLKHCDNPACDRRVHEGVLYCCPGCDTAHQGKYDPDGYHSPACDRTAERRRRSQLVPSFVQ